MRYLSALALLMLGMCPIGSRANTDFEALASAFQTPPGAAPIRVLTVTKTHGFRHGPAIEATKELLAALNETTEFQFDVTENVDDLNDATLAGYDILFFANSTLRVDAADAPEASDTLAFEPGNWRNFSAAIKTG